MQDAKRTIVKALDMSRSASAGAFALLSAVVAGAVALAFCAPAAAATATRPAEGATGSVARLYATAVVTDDEIRLADVAELSSDAAKLAGVWVIAISPNVGGTRVVDLDTIERALMNKGANLSQWIFRGSSRCVVSRPKNCIRPTSRPSDSRTSRRSARAKDAAGPAHDDSVDIDPNSLEAALRTYIGAKLSELGGEPVIKFSPVAGKALALTRPQYEFRVTDRATQPLGMMPVEVEISEHGQSVQTLPMLVHVSLRKPVVVAARPINRSQRIDPNDLTLSERFFDRIEDVGLSDISPLVGQQAKRAIERGDQLGTRDVEPVPLIQRNDLVTVWVRKGGISVKGAAKAMKTAGYGEAVTLKNEASHQEFTAVVTGPRTAEVSGEMAMLPEVQAR